MRVFVSKCFLADVKQVREGGDDVGVPAAEEVLVGIFGAVVEEEEGVVGAHFPGARRCAWRWFCGRRRVRLSGSAPGIVLDSRHPVEVKD